MDSLKRDFFVTKTIVRSWESPLALSLSVGFVLIRHNLIPHIGTMKPRLNIPHVLRVGFYSFSVALS